MAELLMIERMRMLIRNPISFFRGRRRMAAVSAVVDDRPGWQRLSGRGHDRDWAEMQELYTDVLQAWRQNPLAKRIIDITADYVLGDGITMHSPFAPLDEFIQTFWHHRQNRLDLRLAAMVEELSRAGDLFPVLFRNQGDGMSYVRFVTKDTITQIVTAPHDWETELAYIERSQVAAGEMTDSRTWRGPAHPRAAQSSAIMLHYAVNRPVGALLGESDLATMIPWLVRYSRLLEDRVRVHWAVRAFLWFVTVPSNRVAEKQEQYRTPPEAGSIVVKDDAEEWEVKSPLLRAGDAAHDLLAVRRMIDAGSGFPPHWRGEPENATLATAEAMQAPAERRLRRRQLTLVYALQDMLYHAYQRARPVAGLPPLPTTDFRQLFTPAVPDISRRDNLELARSAQSLAAAYRDLVQETAPRSRALTGLFIQQLFKTLGEPQPERVVEEIVAELFNV